MKMLNVGTILNLLESDTESKVIYHKTFNNHYFESSENGLMIRDHSETMMRSLVIARIFVCHKTQGVGTRWLQFIESEAKQLNCEYVIIECVLTEPMRKLAIRLGYKPQKNNLLNYIKSVI